MMLVTLLAWAFVLLLLPIVAVAYLMDKRFDVRENTSPSEGAQTKRLLVFPDQERLEFIAMIDQNIKEGDLVLIQGTFNGPVYNDREDIYSVILHGGREVVVRDIFLSPPTTGEIVKALKDGHAVETWTGEYWRDFGSLNYWEMLLEINSIDTSTYQYGHRVVKKHEP